MMDFTPSPDTPALLLMAFAAMICRACRMLLLLCLMLMRLLTRCLRVQREAQAPYALCRMMLADIVYGA